MESKVKKSASVAEKNSIHRITKPANESKNEDISKEYIFAWNEIPISQAFINRMIDDVKKWIKDNPEEKFIGPFYRSKGLTKKQYERVLMKHADYKAVHEDIMLELGERLLGKAIENKANWGPTKWHLHNYGQEFRDNNTYHASLQNIEDEKKGPAVVVIERMPETDVVKRKEVE